MIMKIGKSKRINPATKKMGFAARVITNGTADPTPDPTRMSRR